MHFILSKGFSFVKRRAGKKKRAPLLGLLYTTQLAGYRAMSIE